MKHTKIWRIPKPNPALQEIFTLKLGISGVVAQILINRGITSIDEARVFLAAQKDFLHDPFLMKDMGKAVERILQAVDNGENVRIFGDYDVDGITSTSILMRVLKILNARVDYYIPERLTEGYGLNREVISLSATEGISLIVTVDSGISAVDEVEFANDNGIDVIITDHHEPPLIIPRAVAAVNPKQSDCQYPFKELAGAGVAFKLGQALLNSRNLALPDDLLELVCLGTVADIVSLKGENRILVKNGLNYLAATKSIGFKSLIEQCGLNCEDLTSRHIAFQIAPKINAAGRLGDAAMGVKLLLSDNPEEAFALSAELCALNEERQAIEAGIYKEAVRIIESDGIDLTRHKVIVLAREGWHLGVIGIVASRLVQEYYRPVVLLNIDGDTAKGSARSIPSFSIFEALRSSEQYLEKYGGHRMAAGLTLAIDNLASFSKAVNEYADQVLVEDDLLPEVFIDSEIDFNSIDEKLFCQLQMLAPFGSDNPYPVLACRNTSVLEHRTIGSDGKHLKMRVSENKYILDAIGFNLGSHKKMLDLEDRFDVVFALEKNEWRGKTMLQLNVKDFKPSIYADNPFQDKEQTNNSFIDNLFQNAITYLSDDFYRNIADKEEFYTKVAGVTFEDRQQVVAGLYEGERLNLLRELNNPYDSNAVKVETAVGVQVGYLNARLAKHVAPLIDCGERYLVFVSQVTGGGEKNYGANIIVQKALQENTEEHRQKLKQVREELVGLSDDDLADKIRCILLGDNPYRNKQLEAIENLFNGDNTLAVFGTGRGKSAVFQSTAAFKALRHHEMTIILYPLRALVNDQFENMSVRLGRLGLRIYRGNGSISTIERAALFEALEKEEIDILLTTPEFVNHHMRKLQNMKKKVGFFVVDESHHIGLSSHSHRAIYKRLGEIASALGQPTLFGVTATANDEVADEIVDTLKIEKVVIDPHERTNLKLVDKREWHDKNRYLMQIIGAGEKTIIYVNSRLRSVELAAMLREGLPKLADRIIFYHAGLGSEQRNTIEHMFRTGDVTTVVSTSAFGEGIDIPDVKNVVLYHLNFNFTEFNQQCGRCGRNGETAHIHLVCNRRDAGINQFILEAASPDRDSLAKLYTILREHCEKSGPVTSTNDDLAKLLREAGVRHARPNLVTAGLGILEELDLIQRESIGRQRQIFMQPTDQAKNLEDSLRFAEGQEEIRVFKDFEKYFFQATSEELLSFINKPIFPTKYFMRQDGDSVQATAGTGV